MFRSTFYCGMNSFEHGFLKYAYKPKMNVLPCGAASVRSPGASRISSTASRKSNTAAIGKRLIHFPPQAGDGSHPIDESTLTYFFYNIYKNFRLCLHFFNIF